ncbi:hypothetical protein KIV56_17325 [Cryobacterium breve]|uniref:Uncharacterized protein n=1 Tax=Cryobacterium breve TaxID=1259258 RepID=A0ABY7NEC3_9MICO|nr:hypothetical protein [Cryobacterium breve]WBM79904.1 hypothetical protein KIV56_17325 [Cryobacterium breve]
MTDNGTYWVLRPDPVNAGCIVAERVMGDDGRVFGTTGWASLEHAALNLEARGFFRVPIREDEKRLGIVEVWASPL